MDFISAFGGALRNSFCDAARTDAALFPVLFGGPGVAVGEGLGFLYGQFCNREPPNFDPPPLVDGGQCPVMYYVVYGITYFDAGSQTPHYTTTNPYQLRGPIGAPTAKTVPVANGGQFHYIVAKSAQADENVFVQNGGGQFGGEKSNPPEGSVVSVTRIDGQSDNCGSLPGGPPTISPGDNVTNTNVTYVNNEGNTVNLPVSFTFGYATVNVKGEVTIPVTANFSLNPSLDIDGTFNFNTGDFTPTPPGSTQPPGGNGSCNPPSAPDSDPGSAPDGIDETPKPNPEGPPEEKYERIMLGALVTVTQVGPSASIIPQAGNPDVIIPDAGLISFEVRVGGRSGWLEDIRIKNRRQFCPCPWEGGAINVRGTPRVGFGFNISPVYVKALPAQLYPPG